MNYTVADIIIRLKNAVLARRPHVSFRYGRYTKSIVDVLEKEGYIAAVKEVEEKGKKEITATILYDKRTPIFTDVKIISKPSIRVYATAQELAKNEKKLVGNVIVSTNQGLMTGKEARKKGLGGELLFEIW